jgi:hypothetical protein
MEVMFENQVKTLLLPDVTPMYARQALDNRGSGGIVSDRSGYIQARTEYQRGYWETVGQGLQEDSRSISRRRQAVLMQGVRMIEKEIKPWTDIERESWCTDRWIPHSMQRSGDKR